jgi:hypothetical protein
LAATTNQLCQDVAVIPLLWLLPLAVYLITFIVTFGGTYPRFASTVILILGAVASLLATKYTAEMPILLQIAAFLVLLAGACMVCHGELVAARPPGVNLTSFYLAISVGGVLGGGFVALAAPRIFTSFAELPIFVLIALMVAVLPASRLAAGQSRHRLRWRSSGCCLRSHWAPPSRFCQVCRPTTANSSRRGAIFSAVLRVGITVRNHWIRGAACTTVVFFTARSSSGPTCVAPRRFTT